MGMRSKENGDDLDYRWAIGNILAYELGLPQEITQQYVVDLLADGETRALLIGILQEKLQPAQTQDPDQIIISGSLELKKTSLFTQAEQGLLDLLHAQGEDIFLAQCALTYLAPPQPDN